MPDDQLTDTTSEVLDAVERLRATNEPLLPMRHLIRTIVDGGRPAVVALLGDKIKEEHLPIVSFIESGIDRVAQKLGRRPDVRVDMRQDRDSERERKRTEKRERIVEGYDQSSRMKMQLPQIARWLPGYGFGVWTIKGRRTPDGFRYPHAQLRDPFDCYPGWFGPDQEPSELAVARRVPTKQLVDAYPRIAGKLEPKRATYVAGVAGAISDRRTSGTSWESNGDGHVVVEYHNELGVFLLVPEADEILTFANNPLKGRSAFVVPKRFAFNKQKAQFDGTIGLMRSMAQLNMMAIIASADSVFRETNIIGEMVSDEYRRGRGEYNVFSPGTRIERPTGDTTFQVQQLLNVLERQLRVQGNYNLVDDSISPNSFVTGQGIDRLSEPGDRNVSEYQLILGDALERIDSMRLEWDERMYGGTRKTLRTKSRSGGSQVETYDPAEIDGNYVTRRVYGVMAGWDEPAKIVTGLQLLGAGVIDRQTMADNLDGLENRSLVFERIDQDRAFNGLMTVLEQRGIQQDPAALSALIEIAENPGSKNEVLRRLFTPEEPEQSPEEEAFLQQNQPVDPGAREGVTSILSRLQGTGETEGGVQTVATA